MKTLFLILVVLFIGISSSADYGPITMRENANITLDDGHILDANLTGVMNPSTDSDVYVFTALWDSVTVAQWANGTLISLGTNDSAVLNGVFDIIEGGRIIIKDDLSIDAPITIHDSYIVLELLPTVTITASDSIAQMILIDPPSEGVAMYDINIKGGCLDADEKAAIGINILGHYNDTKLTWGKINDIKIRDCTDAALKLNSTTFLRINDLTTIGNVNGIEFMEGCINTHINSWQSFQDDYGCVIGGTYPAPHQRCEGTSFVDPIVLGSTYCDIYIYEALQTTINDGILDYSTGNSIYLNGNVDWTFISNTYISPMNSSDSILYGRGIIQRGAATSLFCDNCNLVGAYYYAVDLINANSVSFTNCRFSENGRMGTDGGDIINSGADYVTLIGNKFLTTYDTEKYNYVETGGSGAQLNTTMIGNHYTNRMITSGGSPVSYGNSLI